MYISPSTSASISAGRRVEVRRHPRRALHAEPRVGRLRAVVTGAYGDARESSTWATSCGCTPSISKEIAPPRAAASSGPSTVSPARSPGPRARTPVRACSWAWMFVHADVAEVVDGRAQADGLDDRRGAGLELVRDPGVRRPLHRDGLDHLAAAEERRQLVEQLATAPEHADAGRADHLVAGEGQQVGAARDHVDRQLRHGLGGVDDDDRRRPRGPGGRSRRPG